MKNVTSLRQVVVNATILFTIICSQACTKTMDVDTKALGGTGTSVSNSSTASQSPATTQNTLISPITIGKPNLKITASPTYFRSSVSYKVTNNGLAQAIGFYILLVDNYNRSYYFYDTSLKVGETRSYSTQKYDGGMTTKWKITVDPANSVNEMSETYNTVIAYSYYIF